jgi:hypothetical protein
MMLGTAAPLLAASKAGDALGGILGGGYNAVPGFYLDVPGGNGGCGGSACGSGGDPVTPAVPEPHIWALMILGFAFGGVTMRERARKARPSDKN